MACSELICETHNNAQNFPIYSVTLRISLANVVLDTCKQIMSQFRAHQKQRRYWFRRLQQLCWQTPITVCSTKTAACVMDLETLQYLTNAGTKYNKDDVICSKPTFRLLMIINTPNVDKYMYGYIRYRYDKASPCPIRSKWRASVSYGISVWRPMRTQCTNATRTWAGWWNAIKAERWTWGHWHYLICRDIAQKPRINL